MFRAFSQRLCMGTSGMNNTSRLPPEENSLLATMVVVFFRIALGLIGLIALFFFYCEINKRYWDFRVTHMCKKDGGLHLFESIAISHEEFLAWGGKDGVRGVPIPSEENMRFDIPIFERSETKTISPRRPYVWRSVSTYVRRSDGKVLAQHILYARRGGDFPSPAHESYFFCPSDGLISERLISVYGDIK